VKKARVLVVDDSALIRQILTRGLAKDENIEVLGSAGDPYQARDKIIELKPNVLTLDVEMPRMDGVEFLRRLMPQYPIPTVMVSSLTERGKQITLDALDAGAVDIVAKPRADVARGLESMLDDLRAKVNAAAQVNVSHWKRLAQNKPTETRKPRRAALAESTDKVIAIGASTGGTEAIREVISDLPANTPGIVIVQHMPPGFTAMFAERLNSQSALTVQEARDGDRVITGRALIAPGDYHMRIVRSGGMYTVKLSQEEKVSGHRPSVEVLFQSVAEHVASNAVGVILTGMGKDGDKGMLAMRKRGASTIGQDEATCVVYGMPREAYERGGVENQFPIQGISGGILNALKKKPTDTAQIR
jgi:two-component system, chemotaxis family, protein-glutamate methylesterase/glutaminase